MRIPCATLWTGSGARKSRMCRGIDGAAMERRGTLLKSCFLKKMLFYSKVIKHLTCQTEGDKGTNNPHGDNRQRSKWS